MRFIKMHGIGNDFVVLDALAEPLIASRPDMPSLARDMCDRRTGVGADGVVVVYAPDPALGAELGMRIVNADGSEGGVSGNGARCAAKFAVDRGYVMPGAGGGLRMVAGGRTLSVSVRTDREGRVQAATIDMGVPEFGLAAVGADPRAVEAGAGPAEFRIGSRTSCLVSMGNPHMVAFLEEPVETVQLEHEGPMFERHPAFRNRINYHVANVLSPQAVVVRTWERGTGVTYGCGSGACAVAAAAVHTGRAERALTVHMVGGDLDLYWDEKTGRMFMTGAATEVYQGEWPTNVAGPNSDADS